MMRLLVVCVLTLVVGLYMAHKVLGLDPLVSALVVVRCPVC